ncbi:MULTISPECIES: DUF433 domain-containing protein [Sphingobium]|uniref:DUF433 domain-containing protein n=1 Tax=Sphingobium TaxID=165695 RepID=UPI0009D9C229|nr:MULTISPECIES: DUF433 domain-containing protein [Sphingobium]MBG6119106.1 uncharacterized protein (DUF433 family) [Sphingobium sp. JAI105]PSO10706.1 DUF433 domain-containing protein [Sphingobium sp. AEW4]TWD02190.1 uncharacterized protein (DUF433 family) [Sphingobium sp. AEW010]TWD20709.1 uncharacterized protein (DUF433 family) [Sphingobium sp. AEW013]TWD23437.1 uncharacterized protein (DUF433 family) [Sphingobium sp. AEW001]
MFQRHQDFAVYQPGEAARLLGVQPAKIKRWLGGYEYRRGDRIVEQAPLWTSEYSNLDDIYLGFRDLIEIRFVIAFMRAGLGKNSVRSLLSKARVLVGHDYPLSTRQFQTDGRTLFLEIWDHERDGEVGHTIDVRDGQHAFRSLISPTFKDLDFDHGIVSKWHVVGRRRRISIAPAVAFGQPVIDDTGIPTFRILEAYEAERDEAIVARQFEVPVSVVRSAIEFERGLSQKRAAST